jgi:hypothetical protein
MKKYKVIDDRNIYRNDPTCEITHDTERAFVMNKIKTDEQGNITKRVEILNPRKFQNERIVDEKEATFLILTNPLIKLEEIK